MPTRSSVVSSMLAVVGTICLTILLYSYLNGEKLTVVYRVTLVQGKRSLLSAIESIFII